MPLLRAIFALVLFAVTTLQPAYASSSGSAHSTQIFSTSTGPTVGYEGAHVHAVVIDSAMHAKQDHEGGMGKSIAKDCEIHCAPVDTAAIEQYEITCPLTRCYTPDAACVLVHGEYAELVRPPRPNN